MSAIEITRRILKADNAVIAIAPENQIYPFVLPHGATVPAVLLRIVGETDWQKLDGASRYYSSRVSVASIATDAQVVSNLDKACLAALENVTKQTIGNFLDVDTYYADTVFDDESDDRSSLRILRHFYVNWRN